MAQGVQLRFILMHRYYLYYIYLPYTYIYIFFCFSIPLLFTVMLALCFFFEINRGYLYANSFYFRLKISIKIMPKKKTRTLLPIVHSGQSVMYVCPTVSQSARRLACHTAVPDQLCDPPPPSPAGADPVRSWRRLLTSRYHIMNINTTLVYVAYLQVSSSLLRSPAAAAPSRLTGCISPANPVEQ